MSFQNISATELKLKLDSGDALKLIDIREKWERDICHIGGEHVPMTNLSELLLHISPETNIVIYCHHGVRSRFICSMLARQSDSYRLWNLIGGIASWSRNVDPGMATY